MKQKCKGHLWFAWNSSRYQITYKCRLCGKTKVVWRWTMKQKIAEGIVEQRNCDNCKWKSAPNSYPNWNEHTLKCVNHPGIKYFDWEPNSIGADGELVNEI